MAKKETKVFLSYRRTNSGWVARGVFEHLKRHGFDVFMDVESIDSGQFPEIITHQIEARPHFIVILTPGSLVRVTKRGDWLRREIELAIQLDRNVVPVMAERFTFEKEEKKLGGKKIPARMAKLKKYNGVNIPHESEYFEDAMQRLIEKFLKQKTKAVIVPTPRKEQAKVKQMTEKASGAQWNYNTENWLLPSTTALPAPKLSAGYTNNQPTWTAVIGAVGYVLEKSDNRWLFLDKPVYEGAARSYFDFTQSPTKGSYYRVKALGGSGADDSPWSDILEVSPPKKTPAPESLFEFPKSLRAPAPDSLYELPKSLKAAAPDWHSELPKTMQYGFEKSLSAPKLSWEKTFSWGAESLNWTEVTGAIGYVLEEDDLIGDFVRPKQIYKGKETSFTPLTSPPSTSPLTNWPSTSLPTASRFGKSYRVKALGGAGGSDSPWSNIV